ncbi:MAG: hypothetical protein ACRCVK_20195 [Aeromonas veronii]
MVYKNYRDESRKTYGNDGEEGRGVTLEQLNAGSLQRIADAAETMAKGYARLEQDAAAWRERARVAESMVELERRRITALKGHITRLRYKLSVERLWRAKNDGKAKG